jgi:hypothetical protein
MKVDSHQLTLTHLSIYFFWYPVVTIKTQGNNITILHDICWKQVMAGRGNIIEIGADCGKCSCDVLCDPDRCY